MKNYQSESDKSDHSAQVIEILTEIQKSQSLIQILLPESDEIYGSQILAIKEDDSLIFLDALSPDDGNKMLTDKSILLAKANLNGIDITFHTHITNIDQEKHSNRYWAAFPGSVTFLQRRSNHRLTLNNKFAPKVIFITADKKRMEGFTDNISIGGLRAKFDNPSVRYWQKGDRIPNCTMQLSPTTHIRGTIEVHYSNYDKDNQQLIIGAGFTNLSRLQESSIAKYIAAFNRGLRKNGNSN